MERAAEVWGAEWSRQGGRLALPVSAGLRSGRVEARLWTEPAAAGSVLVLRVEQTAYRLRTNAVVVLGIAAAGALTTVVWPLFPRLLPLVPLGLVLAVGAWFLVITRLATSGPEDFLEVVRQAAEVGGEGSGDRSPAEG